jgi:alcohol dehydrogenase (cytochrome c)
MIRSHSRATSLGGAALAATLLICAGAASAQTPSGSEDPNNWAQYHRTSNGWRYSPLDQINRDNIKNLKVAWIHQAGDITGGMQETPIVVDGIVYSMTAGTRVAAIDGKTGREIWRYELKLDTVTSKLPGTPGSRGVTVGLGKVFVATLDGRAIALNQQTGKEVWSVQLTDFNKQCASCILPAPPVLADNVLIFGSAAAEVASAGKLYGVDPHTGQKLWVFDVIKKDPESWPEEEAAKYGGGGAWLPGSYDAETDTVFYGTSNPATDAWGEDRKGDNFYTDTVLALEPRTGRLKWYRQEIEHDLWDFDSAYEFLLINRNGKDLMVHLNKSGFVFVMDKHDGRLENIWPLIETYNFAKGIDPKTGKLIDRHDPEPGKKGLFCPSMWGGRSWNHGAYNPKTGLWYTNVLELCDSGIPVPQKGDPQGYGVIRSGLKDWAQVKIEGKSAGRLDARDPLTGERRWTYEMSVPLLGSVLTTGGGLVFNGDPFGTVRAFDADNGKVLWSFNTGSGLRSGIVSYALDGKQYILVPSGWGSFAAIVMPAAFPEFGNLPGASTLIAFTLD